MAILAQRVHDLDATPMRDAALVAPVVDGGLRHPETLAEREAIAVGADSEAQANPVILLGESTITKTRLSFI